MMMRFLIAAVAGLALTSTLVARVDAKDLLDPANVPGLSLAGLAAQDVSGFREAFVRPGVDFTKYEQVILQPLGFSAPYAGPPGLRAREDNDNVARVTERNREYLARRFGDVMTDRLSPARSLVAAPGAAPALKIEAMLVKVRPNRTPYDMREPNLLNAYIYGIGAASIVITVKDAQSGEILMALADRREGEQFRDNFNLAFFWGDAEQFLRRWAYALSEALPVKDRIANR